MRFQQRDAQDGRLKSTTRDSFDRREPEGVTKPLGDVLRVIRDDGSTEPSLDPQLSESDAVRLYRWMMLGRVLDNSMLGLQRQGRIGFYAPAIGQEAAVLGATMALGPKDWLVPQYREPAAALFRGMPLTDLICHLIGNAGDPVQGRQMPCHYVHREGGFVSISSVVGTQILHAVGIAWGMRIRGENAAVLVFFGDGATSASDFHVGMNFAGVYEVPCVFLCNNNQWAISLPVSKQTASPTLAQKAEAYGFEGVRVDGMDALAVFRATREAVQRAYAGEGPGMIEAVTYRFGPHSSSDDPARYRTKEEEARWMARDPLIIFRRYLERSGWWDSQREAALRKEVEGEVGRSIEEAERLPPPAIDTLFTDVYADPTPNLREQQAEAKSTRRG